MTAHARCLRPRPRSLRSGAFFVLTAGALLLAPTLHGPAASPATLAAQEPDTLAQDTLAGEPIPGDTVAQDTLPGDTLGPPPPTFPQLDPRGPAAWSRGVWEWDRLALRRLGHLSLLDLLERLPGVVPVRADIVNQAESAAIFGATAGAIRYVMDGFELDPLVGPGFDPSRLPLVALERVRIERGVTGATVRLETLSPDHPRPRTLVEAATGDFDVNLFRGVFLGPNVLGGPVGLGFERLASDGAIGGGSNHIAGWVKWSWVRDSAGVQVEYRQSDMDRTGVGTGLSGARRDWVVRARAARGPVTGEVYAGASHVEDDRGVRVVREGTPQGGIRVGATLGTRIPVETRGALRLRDHPRLPLGELELGLRAAPLPLVTLEAEAVRGWWGDGPGTGRWTASARAGPVRGVTAFGEIFVADPLTGGGSTLRVPSPAAAPLRLTRQGARLGAELRYGGLALGAAAVRTTADTVPGLGLPAEGGFPRVAAGAATGVELTARLPTGWDPLRLEGWYVGMRAPDDWLYLPPHHWRAGIVYHQLPLPSGNLELFVRLEHLFRGRMTAPAAVVPEAGPGADPGDGSGAAEPPVALTRVGALRSTNLELTIRVLTVRAFLRWENIRNRRDRLDLPGFEHPGQHVLYGVKWDFLN